MATPLGRSEPFETLRMQNQVVHLIRKLRWMGLDDEAKRIQATFDGCERTPADSVLGGPVDTD
jgi:hypothetical protein